MKFFDGLGVVSQIALAADKDDGQVRAEVKNLGDPLSRDESAHARPAEERTRPAYLFLDVVQGVRRVDGEADQDNVRVGV